MTFQEIQELIKLISKSNIAEFKMEDGEFKLSVRTGLYRDTKAVAVVSPPSSTPAIATPLVPVPAVVPPAPQPTPVEKTSVTPEPTIAKPAAEKKYLEIRSPMVGTFYRSASPEKPPFVEVGQKVKKGDVVCIIEAMKLFNEIESEVSGTIVEVKVENERPVEYDQVLFLVAPE